MENTAKCSNQNQTYHHCTQDTFVAEDLNSVLLCNLIVNKLDTLNINDDKHTVIVQLSFCQSRLDAPAKRKYKLVSGF